MQKCNSCGADLPKNTRFCGKCGSVQASAPAWSPVVQAPTTPLPPPAAEDEDEPGGGLLLWPPLSGAALGGEALLGSGQVYPAGAPVVQGTPQIGSIPSVAGTPTPSTKAPASYPTQAPTNAPISQPAQAPSTAPVSHPAQGPSTAPVSHPVGHPVQGPQPPHNPPKGPETGTQEHHPPHKHREHQTHHAHHTAAHVTKVAGGSSVKTILIVVTAVVVVAAGGIAAVAHSLTRSQPFISIASKYTMGNTPAGATGTVLHISGQQFSSNSAITILLGGQAAPGSPGAQSDSNGIFHADVTITSAWSVGTHTLTARDTSNNSTKNGISVTIVPPGQANTPGPGGAPPNDASFRVIAHIQAQARPGNPYSAQEIVVVTGHPDPVGGTVCQTEDSGQPIVVTGFTIDTAPVPYQRTVTLSCAGNYKGGKLTLTERLKSDVLVYSEPDGTTVTCTLNSSQPVPDEQLSGRFTGNNTFSGTITYLVIPGSDYSCSNSYTLYDTSYAQHNWTGQVTDLHT